MKATENAWSTLPAGALISTTGKVLEAPPFSVSRAINQEPKNFLGGCLTQVHTYDRAHTLFAHTSIRVSTCPGPPVSFTTDSTYQRPSATVHEGDASWIPAAFRPDAPAGSYPRLSRYRAMRRRKRERRKRLQEHVIRSSGPLTRNDT